VLNLRTYQQDCLAALETDFRRGRRSLLVQKATGTGKTITFLAWLDRNLQPGQRALILAHRRELIEQPIEKARRFFPGLADRMGVVMADHNDVDADIVVATVQTLNSNGRLLEVLDHGAIDLYVVDEAHHDTAETYRNVENALREINPNLRKTGWTATPTRTDRDGLVDRNGREGPYDRLAFRYPVQQAVRDGALCEFSAYAAGVPISVANIRETPSGWENTALGDILNAENVWDVVLDAWRGRLESAPDCSSHSTIVFTASVAQAHGGAAYFRDSGVSAEAIDGTTPDDERAAILKRFKAGETQMVVNCQVLTEGFDAPSASCCLMVSPTKSPLVWTQKAGRILRLDPDNPDKHAIIVDFYPIERTNVFAADALGVPKRIKDAKEAAEEQGVMIGGWSVDRFGRSVSIDTDQVVFRMLDLMSKSALPWSLNGHIATTALTDETAAAIVLPDPDRLERAEELRTGPNWSGRHERVYDHLRRVRLYSVFREGYRWKAELIGYHDDPDGAKAAVDGWPRDDQLGSRSARWRERSATGKQLRYLRRLMPDAPDEPTKGEASRLISEALTIQAAEKAEARIERRLWRE
jgi:superfamily II DNA or RNA helicase